jgi:hypothetical protein
MRLNIASVQYRMSVGGQRPDQTAHRLGGDRLRGTTGATKRETREISWSRKNGGRRGDGVDVGSDSEAL